MFYNLKCSFGVLFPCDFESVAPWSPEREVETGSSVRFGHTGSSLFIYPFSGLIVCIHYLF